MVYPRTSVNCKIIMHTYDYAIPNGKGVFGEAGWLKPALVDAKVPGNLQAIARRTSSIRSSRCSPPSAVTIPDHA